MNTYYYSASDDGSWYELDAIYDFNEDAEYIAEMAAKDYFNNHDGWESRWPLDIYLIKNADDNACLKISVGLEHEPTFTAIVI